MTGDGMQIAGTRSGRYAERAVLARGDILLKIDHKTTGRIMISPET